MIYSRRSSPMTFVSHSDTSFWAPFDPHNFSTRDPILFYSTASHSFSNLICGSPVDQNLSAPTMDMAHFEPTIRPPLVSHLLESPCATYSLMIINV
ncbi:hypothetical protein M6B38_122385 [Iris pallida]|uniref:Uncharacterized protein n=1 Tax=Iris pallida TaxID=29817 RepID=A0AAX6H9E3_IRIPA|nr:hypothetical protein M6B38_122385 [Iris pallida]